ncbi:3-phosphoshikimate 1-carboxyvinyltransferase [Buchnera aphidicola]|uniref:3-phosphoshikimate 1-carboxyvinyltransferase n=1 Tax=Buchnera aphidicola (Sarucallis kahawaluokalani) TaxID=1241878 RepID=A0A4D6Y7V5_9GAMM|nr:3-phosphoshikimate 1-carboxyvinyltransferase [Buchnera aphidicola]QCI26006.1 3-phosphoshikimate 1-carboxyvinyltransferase [Buchnera aphidicola (Sarucallis kahawaluokalani)]
MVNFLTLKPIDKISGSIQLPGSKSISNRVLLLSAISDGTTYIKNLLYSDDIIYMLNALRKIGIKYRLFNKTECIIWGCKNIFQYKPNISLFLGNAGTAVRPLTAILSLQKNKIIITGDDRMKERPIKDLIDALQQGGGNIEYLEQKNYLPICLKGGFSGGNIFINGDISSQFLTSLLIAAPLANVDTNIIIRGTLVSIPYIDITLKIMQDFGIIVHNYDYKKFYIPAKQKYKSPKEYYIEGDASSATYFLAAAAIKGRYIKVKGINKYSIQGDIKFIDVLKKMGAKIIWGRNYVECIKKNILKGINLDANTIPDAAMTIAMLALFTDGSSTTIKNIYNWRVKETDRLHAMATELKKVGAIVTEGKDFIIIHPPKKIIYSKINTYNDHRIAMCFSLIALSNQSVTIINPECVSKTFPNFFNLFNKISHWKK